MGRRRAHTLRWRELLVEIIETSDWKGPGWTRLDIRIVEPAGAPLPCSEDGRLTHGVDADDLARAGGAAAYVAAWLDRDAATPRYAKALARWRQLDLF